MGSCSQMEAGQRPGAGSDSALCFSLSAPWPVWGRLWVGRTQHVFEQLLSSVLQGRACVGELRSHLLECVVTANLSQPSLPGITFSSLPHQASLGHLGSHSCLGKAAFGSTCLRAVCIGADTSGWLTLWTGFQPLTPLARTATSFYSIWPPVAVDMGSLCCSQASLCPTPLLFSLWPRCDLCLEQPSPSLWKTPDHPPQLCLNMRLLRFFQIVSLHSQPLVSALVGALSLLYCNICSYACGP